MEVDEHEHPLKLIDLQPEYVDSYDEDEDENKNGDLVIKQEFRRQCGRCRQDISIYHRYYYECAVSASSCEYSLHKFCAELPTHIHNTSRHPHPLLFSKYSYTWNCSICKRPNHMVYVCRSCLFFIDVNCIVELEGKKIHHPCHPHPLVPPINKPILCHCNACGKEHKGIFYHCTMCPGFTLHEDCAFLPQKLLIQQTTNDVFRDRHPLILSYCFLHEDQNAKFYPRCRVCSKSFYYDPYQWIYKCEKCWYYVHLDCATSRIEPFMHIFMSAGLGRTIKSFGEDVDQTGVVDLPFPDQNYSLLNHLFLDGEIGYRIRFEIDEGNFKYRRRFEIDGGDFEGFYHRHLLDLVYSSSNINLLPCHNPMKKIELLCNGCLRPIMNPPFYQCIKDQHCKFALHEWCTQLPTQVKNHQCHREHTLVRMSNISRNFFGVFECDICRLPCNGFAYSCIPCDYYIDVTCAFLPKKITHDAHPDHLLSLVTTVPGMEFCTACSDNIFGRASYCCHTCDFYLHTECALLLPQTIRHKYDEHPLNLCYLPVENHKSEYYCEICEVEFDPACWFYHCHKCAQSLHTACAPLMLESERSTYEWHESYIYHYVNIKFGGVHHIRNHRHPLSFVQGIATHGRCVRCDHTLHNQMVFKCMKCKFALDYDCCKLLSGSRYPSKAFRSNETRVRTIR